MTVDDVTLAQLIKDKSAWVKYPQRMLWWRAATAAVDDWFPEVAFGLYTPDEIGAAVDADGHVIDVDSVEMPEGYEAEKVELLDESDVAEFKQRGNALSGDARVELKRQMIERELPVVEQVPAKKRGALFGLLESIEKRFADDSNIEDAVVVEDEPTPAVVEPASSDERTCKLCDTALADRPIRKLDGEFVHRSCYKKLAEAPTMCPECNLIERHSDDCSQRPM